MDNNVNRLKNTLEKFEANKVNKFLGFNIGKDALGRRAVGTTLKCEFTRDGVPANDGRVEFFCYI